MNSLNYLLSLLQSNSDIHGVTTFCERETFAKELAELQADVGRLTLAADDAHLSRIAAEEERELLRTQLASMRKALEQSSTDAENELRAKVLALQSCEVDAKRYRWLRECSICRSDRSCHVVWNHYDNGTFVSESQPSKDVLDQLIDEAMPSAPIPGGLPCGCTDWEKQQRIHCRNELTQHPECPHLKLKGEQP